MLHLCAAKWQRSDGARWQYGAVVLTEPGLYDVVTFINADGSAFQGDVWTYELCPYKGSITIPTSI